MIINPETKVGNNQLTVFRASPKEWATALIFLVSLSLVGLGLYVFYVPVFFLLIDRYFRNREEFVVEIFILATYSGFITDSQFPVKWCDILLIISVVILVACHFSRRLEILNVSIIIFILAIVLIALLSHEPFLSQVRMMRYYFLIIVYLVPFLLLKGCPNGFMNVGKYLILYSIIISAFYVLDGFVLNGMVLVPNTPVNGETGISKWNDLYWAPFSTFFPRKYPQGLYILFPTVFYLARFYKLHLVYWFIIAGAMIASRTMTVIVALAVTLLLSIPDKKKILKLTGSICVLMLCLYFVDRETNGFLRISSTMNQFAELPQAIESQDVEMMSDFASGRIAQAFPKWEQLVYSNKVLTGFGFIHPDNSNRVDLLFRNTLYSDQSRGAAIELPVDVEITQFQTVLNIGIIGLLLQIAFFTFIAIWVYRHNRRNSVLFIAVLFGVSIAGLGGFVGLTTPFTMWLSLSLALALLPVGKTGELHKTI